MSVSTPERLSPRSTDPADRTSHDSAHDPSERRRFPGWRWVAVGSPSPSPGSSAGRSADAWTPSTPRWWAARSPEPASAPSSGGPPRARSGARQPGSAPAPSATRVGLAAGAALVGYDTDLGALALMGLVSGAVLGAAQGLVLARQGRRGLALPWAVAMPVLFALGWCATSPAASRRRPVHGVRCFRRRGVHAAQRASVRALHTRAYAGGVMDTVDHLVLGAGAVGMAPAEESFGEARSSVTRARQNPAKQSTMSLSRCGPEDL